MSRVEAKVTSTRTSGFVATIVGEAPSETSRDVTVPFSGRSGDRLRALLDDDLARFRLLNLFARPQERWHRPAARASAYASVTFLEGEPVLLMGRRVATAFGFGSARLLEWQDGMWVGSELWVASQFVVFPHPSGLNRWWNEPDNVERARRFLRDVAEGRVP